MTFSITARCERTGELGVAVATALPGVGGICPYVQPDIGAMAIQASINPRLRSGFSHLAAGMTAQAALDAIIAGDQGRDERQVGIVDREGRSAAWSGSRCWPWSGHITGPGFAAAGNMLAGENVMGEMAASFNRGAKLDLPERLLRALEAGHAAGGDRRGHQSAALQVCRPGRPLDLRIDAHGDPVVELRRSFNRRGWSAKQHLADVFARHERVFLAFSGGKESVVLAHLCEPYKDRVTLLWVNTGAMFPHMIEWVRSFGKRFRLVEIPSDVVGHWSAAGLPAEVLAVENALPDDCHKGVKVQAWPSCCAMVRTRPMAQYLEAQVAPVCLIGGQRRDDKAPGTNNGVLFGLSPAASVERVSPLLAWSTDEVMAYIEEHGLALPSHYSEVSDSLECWSCPAAFLGEEGGRRFAYMAKHHPHMLRIVLPGIRTTLEAATKATDKLSDLLAQAG